ncbi:hypothetical protein [Pseudomonas sp. UBA2684]|uniref:hypothetical protein n=1 Tax=Pseudomonas sp. UBA2684 TaxID=1947311 RepID=UPI000E85D595|nr:hypothetical protein [Pseudomonas sp. UBA2684]HBX57749.1 hypothetical protein [Pseudomonas sp.]
MTGKQDVHGQQHAILGIIDHGSRRLLALTAVPNKSAWTLLGYLFLAIGRYGKPQAIQRRAPAPEPGWPDAAGSLAGN